jgi:hypothetical protein
MRFWVSGPGIFGGLFGPGVAFGVLRIEMLILLNRIEALVSVLGPVTARDRLPGLRVLCVRGGFGSS